MNDIRLENLTVADHTAAVKAVLDNSVEVLRSAGPDILNAQRRGQFDVAMLIATCPSIDDRVKETIGVVESVRSAVDAESIPLPNLRVAANLASEVGAQPDLPSVQQLLEQNLENDEIKSVPGLTSGVELTLAILEDGADSIYDPTYHETITLRSSRQSVVDDALDLGKADVAGGLLGSAIPGAGTLAGAVTASTTRSVVKAAEAVWDWLTS